MTYKLTATIAHKSFDKPLVKELYFTGDNLDAIIEQMDTLPHHKHNLKKHMRTAFKDARGVKHTWQLKKLMTLP